MGGLSKLKELFARPELLFAPMDDPFIQIDKGATSERLQLKVRGAEQGAIEQPPTQFETFDAIESEVVATVHEAYARAQNDASNSIRSYDSRIAELALLTSVSQIGVSSKVAVGDFKASVANALNRLSNSRDAIVSSYSELRDFRTEHGLRRPAHRSVSKASAAGYILGSLLIETLLNSVLLRQNDSMGLLGGIASAAAIGALNVGVAAVVGRFTWPLLFHRSVGRKTMGWIAMIGWLALVGVWNWGAAHYRDAKASGVETPEVAALSMLGGNLDSIYSWALLIAGIIFALIAAFSAFKMDDPYPGYGGVSRRHEERCDVYAEDVLDATAELTGVRDRAIEEALSVRSELTRQQGERGQIHSARSAFVRRFSEFSTQLEVIGNALLQDYRTANMAARTTPPPPTFLNRWTLAATMLPPPPPATVSDDEIKDAEAALEAAASDISAAFDHAITKFEPLDELKRRLADG